MQHRCHLRPSANNGETPGRLDGHDSHLHRSKESLRSGAEGRDMEMHEGAQRTRKVCSTDAGHIGPIGLSNKGAQWSRRKG